MRMDMGSEPEAQIRGIDMGQLGKDNFDEIGHIIAKFSPNRFHCDLIFIAGPEDFHLTTE
jgi:hypothetical protein